MCDPFGPLFDPSKTGGRSHRSRPSVPSLTKRSGHIRPHWSYFSGPGRPRQGNGVWRTVSRNASNMIRTPVPISAAGTRSASPCIDPTISAGTAMG
jgi:hypothetical protein